MECCPSCLAISLLLPGAGTVPAQAGAAQRAIDGSEIPVMFRSVVMSLSPRVSAMPNVWIGFEDLDVQLSHNRFELPQRVPATGEVKVSSMRAQLGCSFKVMTLRDASGDALFWVSTNKDLNRGPAN